MKKEKNSTPESRAKKRALIACLILVMVMLIEVLAIALDFIQDVNGYVVLIVTAGLIILVGYPIFKESFLSLERQKESKKFVAKKIEVDKLVQIIPIDIGINYHLFFLYVLPKFAKFYAIKIKEDYVTICIKFNFDDEGIYYFLRHESDEFFLQSYEVVPNGEINPLEIEKMDEGLREYWK